MSNYYRVTVYNPKDDYSVIADSNGYFERLWQLSVFFMEKGFEIIEVADSDRFAEGDLPLLPPDLDHVIIRYCKKGKLRKCRHG